MHDIDISNLPLSLCSLLCMREKKRGEREIERREREESEKEIETEKEREREREREENRNIYYVSSTGWLES